MTQPKKSKWDNNKKNIHKMGQNFKTQKGQN